MRQGEGPALLASLSRHVCHVALIPYSLRPPPPRSLRSITQGGTSRCKECGIACMRRGSCIHLPPRRGATLCAQLTAAGLGNHAGPVSAFGVRALHVRLFTAPPATCQRSPAVVEGRGKHAQGSTSALHAKQHPNSLGQGRAAPNAASAGWPSMAESSLHCSAGQWPSPHLDLIHEGLGVEVLVRGDLRQSTHERAANIRAGIAIIHKANAGAGAQAACCHTTHQSWPTLVVPCTHGQVKYSPSPLPQNSHNCSCK